MRSCGLGHKRNTTTEQTYRAAVHGDVKISSISVNNCPVYWSANQTSKTAYGHSHSHVRPLSRGSLGQREKAAADPEMMVPEAKPKTTEYTIKPALVVAEFIQKMTIPVTRPPSANIFNRSYLSASTPGMIRPNVEAALIIGSMYPASVGSMPLVTARVE